MKARIEYGKAFPEAGRAMYGLGCMDWWSRCHQWLASLEHGVSDRSRDLSTAAAARAEKGGVRANLSSAARLGRDGAW
jgi:hypothetical protein